MKKAEQETDALELSNWAIIIRLLILSWRFRARCLQVLAFQLVLLAMGLGGLGLTGLGIDYLRSSVDSSVPAPSWPLGLSPGPTVQPLTVIVIISAGIFGFAVWRAVMNFFYTIAAGKLVHKDITVNLRSTVYDKLQKLSFRFFDENASGGIINRVTADVQAVRMFIDGHDILSVTGESLHRQMGLVLQQNFLITGTVMDNIRLGKTDASDE
jgi:ATP-binding cassette subfamily B protein